MTERKQSLITITGNAYVHKIDLQDENNVIKGKVSLRVADKEVTTFEVYESKFTQTGKENFKYVAYQTIIAEYIDSTKVEKGKLDETTKVYIGVNKKAPQFPNATISINTFEVNGSVLNRAKNKLSLMNRVEEGKNFIPGLKFKINDFVVKEVKAELDKVTYQPTGRGILEGFIIDYHGVAKPIELVVNKDGYDYARKSWKENDVVDISGIVFSKAIPVQSSTSVGFGQMPGENSYDYIKEYIVDAGSNPKVDSFTKQEIETAIESYEKLVQELLCISEEDQEAMENIDDGDIPF